MKLFYSIPFVTALLIILTASVNIFGFQYFSEQALSEYVLEVIQSEGEIELPDPEKLQAFLMFSKLDTKTQEEYLGAIRELSVLSNAISSLSENPELYIGSGEANGKQILIGANPQTHSLIPKIKISEFLKDSPEGRFVTHTFFPLIWLNILWISITLIIYFIWVRSIFRPIRIITANIRNIIDHKQYTTITYPVKNEFFPLISVINNLQKSLSIQEQLRSEFLSDISHEIRTPITAVTCYLEAIEDGVLELNEENIHLLKKELFRLTDITGRIMDYEHLTSDIFHDVKVEYFDIQKKTENTIESYRPQLEKLGQKINLQFTKDAKIRMDSGMYTQVLHNIFSNFIKYAGKNTTLTLSIKKTPETYIIRFSDNGKGIPEHELGYVTEKFYRVDKSRTRGEESGMGIGLSICERIAKLHHGSFVAEANHPKGVVFTLTIQR